MIFRHGLAGLTHKAAAAGGGISIVGWAASGAGRSADLTALDDFGSAAGTGDGGTIAENDVVFFAAGYTNVTNVFLGVDEAGWTKSTETYHNNTDDVEAAIFWKAMGPTPDTAVTVTDSGAALSHGGTAIVLRGVDTTTPLDVTPTTVLWYTGPAITPTTAGSWIFTTLHLGSTPADGSSVDTAPANMSNVGGGTATDGTTYQLDWGAAYYTAWTSGSFDPDSWTRTAGDAGNGHVGITFAVRPA